MRALKVMVIVIFSIFPLFLLTACGGSSAESGGKQGSNDVYGTRASVSATVSPEMRIGVNIGDKAADFTVRDVDGREYSLSGLLSQGKPVVLYFFASW